MINKKGESYSYLNNLKQAYFEITNKCNLSCGYCYAIQTKEKAESFSLDFFKNIIDKIAENSENKNIEIIFHGGEPLLKSVDYYYNLLSYSKSVFNSYNKNVDFGIQSNLTLLNDEFLALFKKFNVKISTSIDGIEKIHNKARGNWAETITNFIKAKDLGISISPIVVCSKHNINSVEDFFKLFSKLGVDRFQLNIATSNVALQVDSEYIPLNANEIFQVYSETLKYCIKYKIIEEKTWGMLKRFSAKSTDYLNALGCEYPFCHAGTEMIVFTPNGNMYPCSPCVSLAKLDMDFSIGKFGDHISDEKYLATLEKFHTKDNKYFNECSQCEASLICEFNCPGFDRIDTVTRENKCYSIKRFYPILKSFDYKKIEFITY